MSVCIAGKLIGPCRTRSFPELQIKFGKENKFRLFSIEWIKGKEKYKFTKNINCLVNLGMMVFWGSSTEFLAKGLSNLLLNSASVERCIKTDILFNDFYYFIVLILILILLSNPRPCIKFRSTYHFPSWQKCKNIFGALQVEI